MTYQLISKRVQDMVNDPEKCRMLIEYITRPDLRKNYRLWETENGDFDIVVVEPIERYKGGIFWTDADMIAFAEWIRSSQFISSDARRWMRYEDNYTPKTTSELLQLYRESLKKQPK